MLPRRRQLSVSIISLISVAVISLVVWLVLTFFSVTRGLEKNWVDKLVAIAAPVRVTPTENYYHSYYYLIDQHSSSVDYNFRSLGEKLKGNASDPYLVEIDEELPENFPAPALNEAGALKDLAKEAYLAISSIPGASPEEYEWAPAQIRLHLLRKSSPQEKTPTQLTQSVYAGSYHKEATKGVKLLPAEGEPLKASSSLHEVIVPKNYRDAGVFLGDRGELSFYAPTLNSMQEQHLPIRVAGFYDPGLISLGGRLILAPPELVRLMNASQSLDGTPFTNGWHVRLDDRAEAQNVKKKIEEALKNASLDPYWKVETYHEYEHAKDLLQQLESERHIFSLLAAIILLVACSNIISLLIILVKDKRMEIGILQSMGASTRHIALIFGSCGLVMGIVGSLLGTMLAFVTLQNLQSILGLISSLQGYHAFNPLFYGEQLPNAMNSETLITVLIGTALLSFLAGLIPALNACRLLPSQILRSE